MMEHIAWIQGKRENHFDSHSLQDMVLYNAYAEGSARHRRFSGE
jgi:hypothetical protein